MLSTYHCVMSISRVIWVFFKGHCVYHHKFESVDVNEDVHSLIKIVINELVSKDKESILPANIDIYYQGPNSNPSPGAEILLVRHEVKLIEVVGVTNPAFFRMEVVDPLSTGKLYALILLYRCYSFSYIPQ
jgi:hypothetical protein